MQSYRFTVLLYVFIIRSLYIFLCPRTIHWTADFGDSLKEKRWRRRKNKKDDRWMKMKEKMGVWSCGIEKASGVTNYFWSSIANCNLQSWIILFCSHFNKKAAADNNMLSRLLTMFQFSFHFWTFTPICFLNHLKEPLTNVINEKSWIYK